VNTEVYNDGYGDRISLQYPYDPEANALLKDVLGFPAFKWDKDRRVWSIQKIPEVIREAVELLGTRDYDFTHLLKDIVKEKEPKGGYNLCSVTPKGNKLILRWPYIRDAELRGTILAAVKSIPGRKWYADDKCWSIPLAHGHNLHSLLENTYPPLAEALKSEESLSTYLDESIERVAISQAAELTPKKMADIEERLSWVLPEGLALYPFQYVGVAFAEMAHGRCLIGDEMGLGKSVMALAYAILHQERAPYVVVCPANVKYNWRNEIEKWAPQCSVHVVNKGKEPIPSADFIIINYDLMTKQLENLQRLVPGGMIIDESHAIQNTSAKRTQATLELAETCSSVICLSGTAISNRPKEFFTTLNLLKQDQFPSFWTFAQRYCDAWHNGYGWNFGGASNTKELNERTRDFCIRRLKSEVLPDLPPKTRTFMPVQLSKEQTQDYDQAAQDWAYQYDNYVNFGGMPAGFVLNMLTDLRHQCGLMKVKPAADWIEQYHESTGKPLVVFCHHRDVLKSLNTEMAERDLHSSVISGDVSAQERDRIITAFQAGHVPVLICNTVAAKEGITLTAADTVLFIEREWVPSWEEQAEDRVYRIGQESDSVHAVYFSCLGTVDEHFDRVVEQKRQVVKAVLDGTTNVEERESLVTELLRRLQTEGGWGTQEDE